MGGCLTLDLVSAYLVPSSELPCLGPHFPMNSLPPSLPPLFRSPCPLGLVLRCCPVKFQSCTLLLCHFPVSNSKSFRSTNALVSHQLPLASFLIHFSSVRCHSIFKTRRVSITVLMVSFLSVINCVFCNELIFNVLISPGLFQTCLTLYSTELCCRFNELTFTGVYTLTYVETVDNFLLIDVMVAGIHLCMNSPVDKALLQLVQQQLKSLQDDVGDMSVEFESEKREVQQELRNVAVILEEMKQRVETGQQSLECRTGLVEERVTNMDLRINDLKGKFI